MSIEDNIAGRRLADEALEYAGLRTLSQPVRDAFFERIRSVLPKPPIVVDPSKSPMTDKQAEWFGATRMPYGKHANRRVDETPLEYLSWLVGQADEFKADLNRYLLNPAIAKRLCSECGDLGANDDSV